jgi:hypothetical protein
MLQKMLGSRCTRAGISDGGALRGFLCRPNDLKFGNSLVRTGGPAEDYSKTAATPKITKSHHSKKTCTTKKRLLSVTG